jgi:protein-disulfide isomerase
VTQLSGWKVILRAATVVTLLAGAAFAQGKPQNDPLAEVDGQTITADEVDEAIAPQLAKLQEQIYSLRRQRLDALIREQLLAKEAARRGISVQRLLDAEVTSKVGLVTEEEIERVYQANRSRLQGDETEIREQIRSRLQTQKLAAQRETFLQSLRMSAKVAIYMQVPPSARLDVPIDGAPVKGPASALVTIVEFSDFHCPFCKTVLPTLKEIEARYGGKVRLVFRDFPVDHRHPAARRAHEAARCAHEQDKFWAYHDVLFAQAPRASGNDLQVFARDVGLDVPRFEQCMASGRHKEVVEKGIDEGSRLGVNATPTFFINGRLLMGAQPLESFVRVIDEELVRTSAAEPAGQRSAR